MEITKRREIFFLSELRAIACIAIVILHTFYAASVYAPDHTARIAALTTRNLMMWAVPCFVMVSGALLLDPAREVTYRKIFRKYIPRVLAALVLFSVVFQIFDDATGESGIQFKTILYGLQNAVTGSGWKHMWYFEGAKRVADEIGYPVLVRPSYVLGGRGIPSTQKICTTC